METAIETNPLRVALYHVLKFKWTHPALFNLSILGIVVFIMLLCGVVAALADPPVTGDNGVLIDPMAGDLRDSSGNVIAKSDRSDQQSVIDSLLHSWGVSLWEMAGQNLGGITASGVTQQWSDLFTNSDAFAKVTDAASTVMRTFGYACLSIVYLVQLIKVSQRLDGSTTFPAIKDILFLLVFFVLAKMVIDQSSQFCGAVYNYINLIARALQTAGPQTFDITGTWSAGGSWNSLYMQSTQGGIVALLTAFFMWVGSFAMQIVSYVAVLARSLQLYIYSIFAPIPLTFLFLDETRQWGIGFIKNFIALCLAGAIIVMVIILFGPIMQSVLQSGMKTKLIGAIAVVFLGIFALGKSGGWARDVMGG